MKPTPINKELGAALLCSLLFLTEQTMAQRLEVSFQLDITVWPHSTEQVTEHQRIYFGRGIFDPAGWLIQGNFSLSGKQTWWCNGTNIFEQTLITKQLPESTRKTIASLPTAKQTLRIG